MGDGTFGEFDATCPDAPPTIRAITASVKRMRPTARFIHVTHSSDWIDPAAELGEGFYIANLYDERVDANMLISKHGRILVQNTYVASFAYSMFLCWLYAHRHKGAGISATDLDGLLAHNMKKFFAEQIYRATYRVPSRALLLETLLFEQQCMIPIFAEKNADTRLAADADWGAGLMAFVTTMHEMGHFYLAVKPAMWDELATLEPNAIGAMFERVANQSPLALATEFQCDVYAVVACLRQYGEQGGVEMALRGVVFAYAAYAAMYSAVATAQATAALWDKTSEETIDFQSIAPMPHVDYPFEWAFDSDFIRRAQLVTELCGRLAELRGVSLFGDNGPFSLPADINKKLLGYLEKVFDCSDDNARKMSNLVAQAMSGHDEGMEYLYLRSKTFSTRRQDRADTSEQQHAADAD
jgi:hypothetical protein